jgi:hypothetical protein
VFKVLPDELVERLDKKGGTRSRYQLTELMAYYQNQHDDRQRKEWKQEIEKRAASRARRSM